MSADLAVSRRISMLRCGLRTRLTDDRGKGFVYKTGDLARRPSWHSSAEYTVALTESATGKGMFASQRDTATCISAFLDHAADDRLYALWHLNAFRGLRRGEACGLEWPEVDLSAGSIAIVRQRITIAGVVHEDTPKSDAGERTISLDEDTVAALRTHRKQQLADRLAAGASWVTSDKVFCAEDGSPLDPNNISDQFENLTIAAGLPPIRLHDLRHGAASLMLAAGVDMKVVQETLGHSSIALTANTYTSVYPDVATAAAEATARMVPRARRDA